MSLFESYEAKVSRLESMAGSLLRMSSVLGLHAWYQSKGGVLQPTLAAAANDANDAALILLGKEAKDGSTSTE